MSHGVSIAFLVLGCAVLAHCQRPPADDEDFPFSHEGSGREVRGPLSSHSEPARPPLPPSQAEVYGNEVSRRRQQPDFSVDPPTYHGSGHGDDEEYAYDDEEDYDGYGGEYGDDYYDDYGDEDYSDEEYGDYGDSTDGQEAAGGAGQDQHRTPTDHFGTEVIAPGRQPEEDLNIGVVHTAPPVPPEHAGRPEHGGSEHARQPAVFGTERRPTEPPHQAPEDEDSELDNGIEISPDVELPGRTDGGENAIPDSTADGEPADPADPQGGMPEGMGSKAIDRPTSFFQQPGILAAVVGGAVVGLLCAILLVMLIVYRMRKKDEGSYALDEPKRSLTGNSYSKNYNKEFYA